MITYILRLARRHKLLLAVTAIVLVSAPLRLYALSNQPAGLFGDEAADGLDALRIIDGDRPIFLPDNNGREPLHAYLIAYSISLLGRTPAAVRLPSALASCVTLAGIFLVSRSLYTKRIGLLAALICGFTVWPIMLGRLATRPALLPLFLTLGLWAGIEGWKTRRISFWIGSGLLFGAAFYTYTPIRVIVIALPLWAALLLVCRRAGHLWPGALLFGLSLAVVVFPIIQYSLSHPEQVFGRTAGLSVIDHNTSYQQAGTILSIQTFRVLAMFVLPGHGDSNLRHNIPTRPVFDLLMSVALVGGIVIGLRHCLRLRTLLCLVWIAVALIPTILSEEAPHFARASGALAVVMIFPALAFDYIYRLLGSSRAKFATILATSALLMSSLLITTKDYLLSNYLATDDVGFWFDEQCTEAALTVNHFLGAGWQGLGWLAHARPPLPGRQVFLATNVCPRYSSSGYYGVQFLVPATLGDDHEVQRYDLNALPDVRTLEPEVLFLVIPGDEDKITPWLAEAYTATVRDGPWTPPDKLGNSWLVYRAIFASLR